MKIDGLGTNYKVINSKTKKNGVKFGDLINDDFESEVNDAKVSQNFAINSIIAPQIFFDQEKENNIAAKNSAKEILAMLEKLRDNILDNNINISNIDHFNELLQNTKIDFIDPKLSEIIDEIQLRAEVEIAKIEFIKKQKK